MFTRFHFELQLSTDRLSSCETRFYTSPGPFAFHLRIIVCCFFHASLVCVAFLSTSKLTSEEDNFVQWGRARGSELQWIHKRRSSSRTSETLFIHPEHSVFVIVSLWVISSPESKRFLHWSATRWVAIDACFPRPSLGLMLPFMIVVFASSSLSGCFGFDSNPSRHFSIHKMDFHCSRFFPSSDISIDIKRRKHLRAVIRHDDKMFTRTRCQAYRSNLIYRQTECDDERAETC